MTLNNLQLELHVPDFAIVKNFYGQLGFDVVWEDTPTETHKGYLVMKRNDSILCFYAGNQQVYQHGHFQNFPTDTPRGYGVEIALYVDDIDAYYQHVKGFATVVEPLQLQEWGLKDFRIVDPFGYYIRFGEPDDILNPVVEK